MMARPDKPLWRIGLALACCVGLAACAGPGSFGADDLQQTFRDKALAMESAQGMVIPGTSSKADITAALGPAASAVRFDSGYEVWAYREKPPLSETPGAEFVILFAPSGIVQKTRIRPRYEVQKQ
jgi:hypothetical protein